MKAKTFTLALIATLLGVGSALAVSPEFSGLTQQRKSGRQAGLKTAPRTTMVLPRKADANEVAWPAALYGTVIYSNKDASQEPITPPGLYSLDDAQGNLTLQLIDLKATWGGVLAGNTYYAMYQKVDDGILSSYMDAYTFDQSATDPATRWTKL